MAMRNGTMKWWTRAQGGLGGGGNMQDISSPRHTLVVAVVKRQAGPGCPCVKTICKSSFLRSSFAE